MRINWKKKYEDCIECNIENYDNYMEQLSKRKAVEKSRSALKGQLTKLRKYIDEMPMYKELVQAAKKLHTKDCREILRLRKQVAQSADALELVELLEWAKGKNYLGYIGFMDEAVETYKTREEDISLQKIGGGSSLLLALREAKKAVEDGK